jgi:glycosyltransferase involved in cell wall biosynthesis
LAEIEAGDPKMASSIDVTIVVCTRDRAELLRSALSAIRANSPDDVDVVVVDSASPTSATRGVARDSDVRYVRTDIKGLSIARNIGLRATDRPIVVYTDDDCEVTPGWLDALVAAFADEVGAVTGRLLDHSADAGSPPLARRVSRTRDGLDAGHGALMAYRRELLDRLGGFDEVLGAGRRAAGAEDLDMFCRVLKSGSQVAIEPRSVVRHIFTRDDEEFMTLNAGYGRGLGAMSNKWLRFSFGLGVQLTFVMLLRAARRAARHARNRRMRAGALSLLRGIVVGFVEAVPYRVRSQRFVDRTPPAPILLPRDHDDSETIP